MVVVVDDDDELERLDEEEVEDVDAVVLAVLVVLVDPVADAVVALEPVCASTARNAVIATRAEALSPPATLRAFAAGCRRRRRRVAFSMSVANAANLDTARGHPVNPP